MHILNTAWNCFLSVSLHVTVYSATMETPFMLWTCSVMVLGGWEDAQKEKKYLKLQVISENRFRNSAMRPRTLQQIWMYSQFAAHFHSIPDSTLPRDRLSAAIQLCHLDESSWCLFLLHSSTGVRLNQLTLQREERDRPREVHFLWSTMPVVTDRMWHHHQGLRKRKEQKWGQTQCPSTVESRTECRMCVCVWTRVTDLFAAAPLWRKQRLLRKANWAIMYLYFIFMQKCCCFGSDDVTSSAHQMPFSKLNGYYCRYYSDNLLTLIVLMETIHSIKPPDGKSTKLIN